MRPLRRKRNAERWQLKQSRAYQMIDAAKVAGNLQSSTIDEPLTQHPAKGRKQSPKRARSFRRAIAYINSYGGEFPSVTEILGKSKRKAG